MVRRGQKFKHRQIRDVVYAVEAVDEKKAMVYLINTKHPNERPVQVSFQDLAFKYEPY